MCPWEEFNDKTAPDCHANRLKKLIEMPMVDFEREFKVEWRRQVS